MVGRAVDDEELVVPWSIDNKYYTAEVNIQLLELEDDGVIPPGVEVLVYLFDSVSVCPAVDTSQVGHGN